MNFLNQITLFLMFHWAKGLNNGVGHRPPMGFNTWERYRCVVDCINFPDSCISERLVKRTADILSKEYAQYGYDYLVVDDCWLADERDKSGNMIANSTRFPSGIRDLSEYVHSLGLKFGIYGNFGDNTCAGYPGIILYNLQRDAELFISWNVDFVKLDGCFSNVEEKALGYPEFGKYLNKSSRPIVYSCSWPAYLVELNIQPNYTVLQETCNLWRNFDDVEDSWSSILAIIEYYASQQDTLVRHHGPGHFHDPDMLVIGNFGLSFDQSRAQMALWCLLAAPLFLSTELAAIKPDFKEIITNRMAISIDQDPLGIMVNYKETLLTQKKQVQIWRKPILPQFMGYNSYAVAFLNTRTDGHPYRLVRTLQQLGLYNPNGYKIEDVFDGSQAETNNRTIAVLINPTGVVFLRFTVIPDENVEEKPCAGERIKQNSQHLTENSD